VVAAHGFRLGVDPTPTRLERRVAKGEHDVVVVLLDRKDEEIVPPHVLQGRSSKRRRVASDANGLAMSIMLVTRFYASLIGNSGHVTRGSGGFVGLARSIADAGKEWRRPRVVSRAATRSRAVLQGGHAS
jgi:hypothetical protein